MKPHTRNPATKSVNLMLILVFTLAFAGSGFAQRMFSGRVVEIVDGKTFVFEADNGRLTGTIQYIEVPEPEQPLNRIVRDHLEKLVLGKTIVFLPNGFTPRAAVGKAYLDGVDIGQQLIRDGAAWHLPIERSGQEAAESTVYNNTQAMAKAEKRGIWSIANLTPAWEFSAQKDRTFAQAALVSNSASTTNEKKNYQYAKRDQDMWVDVGGEPLAQRNAIGSMFFGYDAEKKIRNVSTPSIAQTLVNGERRLEVELRLVYFQGELRTKVPNTAFVLGVLATSKEHNFARENTLRFLVDGEEIVFDNGQRFWRESQATVQELIQYRINRSALNAMANGKKLSMKIGRYQGIVNAEVQDTLRKLLESSNY